MKQDIRVPPLSDDARRVLEVIQRHGRQGASIEAVCAETMLPPDIVMRAAMVLVQRRRIRVKEDAPPRQIQVEALAVS